MMQMRIITLRLTTAHQMLKWGPVTAIERVTDAVPAATSVTSTVPGDSQSQSELMPSRSHVRFT
jgi:hypothetical protein